MDKHKIVLDAKPSMRTIDDNGFLHVALTPISKATVNPYLGSEIPFAKEHGFDTKKSIMRSVLLMNWKRRLTLSMVCLYC